MIIARGAESIIYLKGETIVKERVRKKYRIKEIDEKLRKRRTRKEAKLLNEARKVGVSTPQILEVDEKEGKIVMEYLKGKRIKEFLKKAKEAEIKEIMHKIGEAVGKLHSFKICHGDLTTSNLILCKNKVYFIDFSLGNFTERLEDFGVDLKLFYDALKSTHFEILEVCWENFLEGYKKFFPKWEQVLEKIKEIEKRARYKER